MAVPKIPSASVEYLHVPISAPAGVTLGGLVVEMAVVPDGQQPEAEDWQTAEWQGADAAALIGPGTDIPLDDGTYDVYVRITSDPETPVLLSGSIHIT